MPWATNPIFKSRGPTEKVDTDVEATQSTGRNGDGSGATTPDPPPLVKGDDDDSGIRPPTDKFTAHQIFYIFILDGIGAAFLSGGINFAIAFGTYVSQAHLTFRVFPTHPPGCCSTIPQ
jgi:hypothetical protein